MNRTARLVLARRYWGDLRSPSPEDLDRAVDELYLENLPGTGESRYVEHGAAALRYGFDGGPMYVVEIDRQGNARFEEWQDPDFERELAPPRAVHLASPAEARRLWGLLAAGDIEAVRGWPWDESG